MSLIKFKNMNNFTIYHNPRCSKSRQTLELMKVNGIEPEVVLYLENHLSTEELTQILTCLSMEPRELLRKNEDEYKELNLKNTDLHDTEILSIMENNPRLIERPIVVSGGKAIIGRPPENVLKLIEQ